MEFDHTYYFENGDWVRVVFGNSDFVGYKFSESGNVKIFLTGDNDSDGLVVYRYVASTDKRYSSEVGQIVINFSKVLFVEMGE